MILMKEDMYADMKFAPDRGAVSDYIIIGVFVATLIGILLVLVSPKRKVGYRQENTELTLDGEEVKNEFETPLDAILKAFDTKRP